MLFEAPGCYWRGELHEPHLLMSRPDGLHVFGAPRGRVSSQCGVRRKAKRHAALGGAERRGENRTRASHPKALSPLRSATALQVSRGQRRFPLTLRACDFAPSIFVSNTPRTTLVSIPMRTARHFFGIVRGACVLVLGTALPSASHAANSFVWLEGEQPAHLNVQPKQEGIGHSDFLSAGNWLKVSLDAGQVDKEAPADGVQITYNFRTSQAAHDEIWARLGYEYVRSPFDWRLDGGEWKSVSPDELTTDLMELSFWTEVAWLKLGEQALPPGNHTLEFRLPKTKDAKGKTQRILFALDALCFSPTPFHPYSHFKPGEEHQTEKDREAARHVFQLSEAADAGSRSSVKLAGLWEVCRNDEQRPGEVAAPITDFPAEPRWTAIAVPGDKNLRDDLLFAHRLWYRTRVNIPASMAGRSFFLVFPQNNLNTTVYVNGQFCGFDKNPFVRVQIDVTRGMKAGATNEIWVGIKDAWYAYSTSPTDPLKLRKRFNLPVSFFHNGFQDLAYPIWNHPQSGILVTPELIAAGRVYASDVFVKPSVAQKKLVLDVTLKKAGNKSVSGELLCEAVNAQTGQVEKKFAAHPFTLAAGKEQTLHLDEPWSNPKLWWPDEPNLYKLRTTVMISGLADVSDTEFGFREWTSDGPDFLLNGLKWHGWADCFTAKNPEEWIQFYRQSNQRTMRFWGTQWLGLPPEQALNFFDREGVVVRRSGMLDGEAIGYNAIEHDPELKKLLGSDIKVQLMTNWLDQVVAQVKGERNHPSVNVWSIENEWLYINCLNLHRAYMDEFEKWVKTVSDAVRAADPTRFTMTDGGGANKDQSMPIQGNHYVFNSSEPEQYPALAYEANVTGGGRGRWIWDQQHPPFIGEDYFANGINPFDYAYFGGEATFQGKAQAHPAAGVIYRMLMQGYRWAGYGAWQFWLSQHEATAQYRYNAPRAVFVRQWDWTFGSGQKVPRTIGLFNDTRFADPITFTWKLLFGGKELARQTSLHQVAPGENEKFHLVLEMPEVESRQEGQFILTLSVNGKEVFRDVKAVSVLGSARGSRAEVGGLPTAPPTAPSQQGSRLNSEGLALAVFDPRETLAEFLNSRHLAFTSLPNLDTLPNSARILLIGPDALSASEATSSRLAAWASSGRRLIVLEPKPSAQVPSTALRDECRGERRPHRVYRRRRASSTGWVERQRLLHLGRRRSGLSQRLRKAHARRPITRAMPSPAEKFGPRGSAGGRRADAALPA